MTPKQRIALQGIIYHNTCMATKKNSTKVPLAKQADEYATFSTALKRVLTVSHDEMKTRIGRASSGRASRAKR